ncbi:hypothetical protein DQX05_19235 [Paenibacillus thiaminolyticus]|uniref:Uncharacterized protein n=1 Tax=Paenibacillus thiaminolyticus TaxID=49283 RepID=A0A3A3GDS5_PANTH|nr:hypothetical protein DQX05_19235 [Paenibacillus thiaminolyticus]
MQRSIGINILDHYYLPLKKYHSTFHLYEDDERHYMLTDILELHFIECRNSGSCPLTSMIRCIAGCGFWNRRPLPNNWRS